MKNKDSRRIFTLVFIIFSLTLAPLTNLSAQRKNKAYEHYISKYKNLAIHHMDRFKIPASITLAQGLLESAAGQSELSRKGNNHFGIKCHDWKGAKMYRDDDKKNECFRKYKKAEDSYHDHSEFLVGRSRYSGLFKLKMSDYRGWAKGLQKAGYATDRAYANTLIKIIEDYELYQYDKKAKKTKNKKPEKAKEEPIQVVFQHTPYKTHGLLYILAKDGDTYDGIAQEFKFKVKDLCKYNEVPKEFPLKADDIVYFENKRSKALEPYYEHVIQVGESMHSISQKYGVKLKSLYKMNKKDLDYVPVEGDILKLR